MHLISMRIEQAEQAIQRVESCLANNQPELAANRVYYGMFYAMLALALLQGFETSKHQQIQGWLNKNFVHTGIFPNQFSKMVKDAFVARTDADYKLNAIPAFADLEAMLADMKLFITTIKVWIEANPAT
ncbi:MAG: HEPN domain-containing protein [Lewinellaceae bacterium]|nr:HEPN domain-containing protein [Lewinellaceae bacterium]